MKLGVPEAVLVELAPALVEGVSINLYDQSLARPPEVDEKALDEHVALRLGERLFPYQGQKLPLKL